MSNRAYPFHLFHHLSGWFLLICLLATACVRAPLPVATSTSVSATETVISAEASTPTPDCAPQPTAFLTQSPAPVSTQVTVTDDGLVQGRVLPSPYLVPTYVRAPIAWARSTGKGVTIGVVQNHSEDLTLVQLVAPEAQVEPLTVDRQMMIDGASLLDIVKQKNIHLLAIIEPGDFDPQILMETTPILIQAGVAVLVNGDLDDSPEQRDLINALEVSGAITVGRLKYGVRIQGRDLYHRQINLFAPYGAEAATSDRGAVLTVAAVSALVLAATPALDPLALKQQLITTADLLYTGINPATNRSSTAAQEIDPQTGVFSPTDSAFWFRRVNAASALGLHLAERWPLNALNLPAAWETATGREVIVGVVDAGFYPNNPLLKDHLVDYLPKEYFNEDQGFHGNIMAQAVVAVAPDVSLMLLHDSDDADMTVRAQRTASVIDYAVQHNVNVLTNSSQSWVNTPEVHAAIDRAIEAGIVFVLSDYNGPNDAVIRPGAWRSPEWEVGTFTFFLDEDRPAELEGGLSFAAPQIAAIAALILENEPNLTPMQVKQRIVETATVLPNGGSMADAAAAVENRPSGRLLNAHNPPAMMGGYLRLQYQAPDSNEPALIEVEEHHQNWPIANWPRQDVLLYRTLLPMPESSMGTFRLAAYQDYKPVLLIEWEGNEWATGDTPARLTLLPEGEWQLYYSTELGVEDAPPVHIDVVCDRLHLSWNSVEGVPLARSDGQGKPATQFSSRLLSFEVETPFMPDLALPIY